MTQIEKTYLFTLQADVIRCLVNSLYINGHEEAAQSILNDYEVLLDIINRMGSHLCSYNSFKNRKLEDNELDYFSEYDIKYIKPIIDDNQNFMPKEKYIDLFREYVK